MQKPNKSGPKKNDIDTGLIWNIWQVANPELAEIVPIESDYAIYRDCDIAITTRADNNPSANPPAGAKTFSKWGWKID